MRVCVRLRVSTFMCVLVCVRLCGCACVRTSARTCVGGCVFVKRARLCASLGSCMRVSPHTCVCAYM